MKDCATGACCLSDGTLCQVLTPLACAAALGTYRGDDVPCGPNVCVHVGDLNCDGSVNFGDINPFVRFLSNFSTWQIAYPGCPPRNGDINSDGTFPSFYDVNPFVALLSGG